MELFIKKENISRTTTGIKWQDADSGYTIKENILNNFNITFKNIEKDLKSDLLVVLDDSVELKGMPFGKKTWYELKEENILNIIIDSSSENTKESSFDKKSKLSDNNNLNIFLKEVKATQKSSNNEEKVKKLNKNNNSSTSLKKDTEVKKLSDNIKNISISDKFDSINDDDDFNNESYDDDQEIKTKEKLKSFNINFDNIYDGLKHYTISELKSNKMSKIDTIIQKSIKLKGTKYFNGKPKTTDINFNLLSAMSTDDVGAFIEGKITTIKIKRLKIPSRPTELKDNPKKFIELLEQSGFKSFITKTDKELFIKEKIKWTELKINIEKKFNAKFNKIAETFRTALEIKRESGVNPFVIAWPFIIGKTRIGKSIHAPLCYRDIEVKEGLDTYELIASENFTINAYPILKNYADNNFEVNEIEQYHSSIEDVLKEFYKHHIKIARPQDDLLINYKEIKKDVAEKTLLPELFTLKHEVILRLKPHDEFIFYDLKNIKKKYSEFDMPKKTKVLFPEEEPPSNENSFITNVDNSKAYVINNSMKKSTVIFGPPGTGKSQTITNIIGKVINDGKSSVFVAEKATAIEVIEKNLKKISMDYFVVNLNEDDKVLFAKKFNALLKIISQPKYKKIKKIKKIDFAMIWFDSQKDNIKNYQKFISLFKDDLTTAYKIINMLNELNEQKITIAKITKNLELKEENDNAIKYIDVIEKQNEELAYKNYDLEKENKDLILKTIKKINDMPIIIDFVHTKEDIFNFSKLVNRKEIVLKAQGKKPFLMNKFISKYSEEITLLKNTCDEFTKKYKSNEEKIKENSATIIDGENELEVLKKINKSFNKSLYEETKEYQDLLSSTSKEKINFIENNIKTLTIDLNKEWQKHLEFKKKKIEEFREITINNYSVSLKKFLEVPNNEQKTMLLKAYINNKLNKRGQTLIKLFKNEDARPILIKFFPCIMMNPDNISKIFPPTKNIFDYAIFDEASQMRLHRAIPTLHRAKNAIVAGDDKQLGPTDLFADISRDSESDLELNEDTSLSNDTLLNYAKDKYFSVQLNTHYRSKASDLIKFSNKTFYNNKIMIADTPKPSFDGNPPIIVEEIGGIWQPERINNEEANRAVELIKHYLLDLKKSVLVITFNDEQKKLITELTIKEIRDDFIEALKNDKLMFKSIKDVQGDEMDIVIFSLTYGKIKGKESYVTQFGQFSKEKINVAITRSKNRVHVLKSFPSYAINSRNEDKRIFKEWLEFIEGYSQKTFDPSKHENIFRSKFEEDYYETFKKVIDPIYVPLMNYKVAGKELDVAIYDTINKEFIGVVELDGTRYHSKPEDVLRDYDRQLFLENLGWKFQRNSFYKFYNNKEECVKENLDNLLALQNK